MRRVGCHDVADIDVAHCTGTFDRHPAASVAEPQKYGRPNLTHHNIGNHNAVNDAAVDGFNRDAGDRGASVFSAQDDAVAQRYVAKIPLGLRAKFEAVTRGLQDAVRYHQIFSRHPTAQSQTGLGADGVVPGIDVAVGDSYVFRAVRIDTVGITVEDSQPFEVHILRADEADVVTGSVAQSDPADRNVTAAFEGYQLRAAARRAISLDRPKA